MKASWYVETARAWIMPGAAAGAFTKYLGFETYQAILAALLVAPIVEGAGYLVGRFMWQHGGTEREYQMALDRDPFKKQSLEHFEAIETLLREMNDDRWTLKPLSAMSDVASAEILRLLEQACRPCWERLAERVKDYEWAESARRNPRPDER